MGSRCLANRRFVRIFPVSPCGERIRNIAEAEKKKLALPATRDILRIGCVLF
jgi:hypothetical protein